jgi:hypothetical protein
MDTDEADMEQKQNNAMRLIPALPAGPFMEKPAEIDRFLVHIWDDGSISFKGSRERIEEFLALCAEVGLEMHVKHLSLCG